MAERKTVVIVGIPGVGKTTVISKLVEKLQQRGVDVKHIVFGSVMFDEGVKRHRIKDRDEIRSLPVSTQRQFQVEAANSIAKMKASVLIVDTHLFIRTKEGFWPGLPLDVLRALNPTNIVLLEADPKEILYRRMKDKTRYRETLDEVGISRELELGRTMHATSAILTGAPLLTVKNKEGLANEAANDIASVLGLV